MLPPPDNSVCYARTQLKGKELQLYDAIVAALQRGQTSLSAKYVNASRSLEIAMLVLHDHPEFYWVAGEASISGLNGKLKLTKCLAPDRVLEAQVMGEFARLTSDIPVSCSDYTKAKKLYTAIARYAAYDNRNDMTDRHVIISHSLWGVFGERRAVCDGFSSALQYLLQHVGIQAYRITGDATSKIENGPHSWVYAKIDGNYYHIDPTWGVVSVGEMTRTGDTAEVNYDYLCLNDKDVKGSHHAKETINIQPCISNAANYYNQEGLLLQAWNEKVIIDALSRQLAQEHNWLALRAATDPLFKKLKNLCQTDDSVFRLIARAHEKQNISGKLPTHYAYATNEELRTIHVFCCSQTSLTR